MIIYSYIPKSYETQSNIISILNTKIQISDQLFANHDKDCVDQVFRVMCHYYLPSCGNISHIHPPTSICQEECFQVHSQCQETWQAARVLLTPLSFINCNDTSQLLFPLPNCCTGAGIFAGSYIQQVLKSCFHTQNCTSFSRCSSSKFWCR